MPNVPLVVANFLEGLEGAEITIANAGTVLPQEPVLNVQSPLMAVDSPTTGSTDLIIPAATTGNGGYMTQAQAVALAALSTSLIPPVANMTALAALSASGFVSGQDVLVETLQTPWLYSAATLTPITGKVVAATPSGSWVRGAAPNYWALQGALHVHPGVGNDENSGVDDAHALATVNEAILRTFFNFAGLQGQGPAFTLSLHADSTETIRTVCDWGILPTVTIDGTPGQTALVSDTIGSVTALNTATGVMWQITGTAITDFSPYFTNGGANAVAIVTSGAHTGATFTLDIAGAGGNAHAIISQPGTSGSFDGTTIGLSAGDSFTIYKLPQFGATFVTDQGNGNLNLKRVLVGSLSGTHNVGIGGTAFFDTCLTKDLDALQGGQVSTYNHCYIAGTPRAYGDALHQIYNSTVINNAGPIAHQGAQIEFANVGLINANIRGNTSADSGLFIVDSGSYLAFLNCPANAIAIGNGYKLQVAATASVFGNNCTAPRFLLTEGCRIFYTNPPAFFGSSGVDIQAAATAVSLAALPYVSLADDIRVMVVASGSPVSDAILGAHTETTTGAYSLTATGAATVASSAAATLSGTPVKVATPTSGLIEFLWNLIVEMLFSFASARVTIDTQANGLTAGPSAISASGNGNQTKILGQTGATVTGSTAGTNGAGIGLFVGSKGAVGSGANGLDGTCDWYSGPGSTTSLLQVHFATASTSTISGRNSQSVTLSDDAGNASFSALQSGNATCNGSVSVNLLAPIVKYLADTVQYFNAAGTGLFAVQTNAAGWSIVAGANATSVQFGGGTNASTAGVATSVLGQGAAGTNQAGGAVTVAGGAATGSGLPGQVTVGGQCLATGLHGAAVPTATVTGTTTPTITCDLSKGLNFNADVHLASGGITIAFTNAVWGPVEATINMNVTAAAGNALTLPSGTKFDAVRAGQYTTLRSSVTCTQIMLVMKLIGATWYVTNVIDGT